MRIRRWTCKLGTVPGVGSNPTLDLKFSFCSCRLFRAHRSWKMFPTHNCFLFESYVMKLYTQTLHESRMCPFYFWVKRSRSQCIAYWRQFMSHNCNPFTPIINKLYTDSPLVADVPYWLLGLKVKGKGHNALIAKNSNLSIIALPSHLLSWNFIHWLPMSWGMWTSEFGV